MAWYSVRCIIRSDPGVYEERITLWQGEGFDEAIAKAEAEAEEYAFAIEGRYINLAQAFLVEDAPAEGVEVFSLIRESDLEPDAYLTQFFDTGRESQQTR